MIASIEIYHQLLPNSPVGYLTLHQRFMKLYFTLFCFFALNYTHAQVNLSQGLIGCYPFSGNADDLSSSNNNGTVTGAKLTADRFGVANSAYSFDGIDDYIEISAKDLELNTFTYSFWLYPRNLPLFQKALFAFSIGSSYGDQYVLIGNQYPDVLHGISNGSYMGVNYNVRCMTGTLPQLNQWYHVVLSKDIDNYYFYINGKLLCANPTKGSSAFYGTGIVRATIGARNNYGQAINAIIDDIHLYNRNITPDEVDELYKGISLQPAENITLTQDKSAPCGGDQINIIASQISKGATYVWKVDGNIQSNAIADKFTYDLPKVNSDYQTIISVEAHNNNACFPSHPSTNQKIITVKNCDSPVQESKKLFIPDVFTPNKDGHNDTWELVNASEYPTLELRIYSRWGELIFHSVGYSIPWDGTYKGEYVSSGTYPYKMYTEGNLIKEGTVTIIR